MKGILKELNNVFIHQDLYYHFLCKFPTNDWINLDKQELIKYIKDHIPSNPEKLDGDHYTHEYYIVLSYVNNKVPFKCSPVHSMLIEDFREWYRIAIQSLIHHDIYSDEEMLIKMYENN